jgi:hypothetical protein
LDTRSIQSDTTVIENKDVFASATSNASVITIPQSPSQIRKKFQKGSSFEKTFTKSSEVEFSKEFQEGIRGKVKDSTENYLRQASLDMSGSKSSGNRNDELEEIKCMTAQNKTPNENKVATTEIVKQEKLQELEEVKRSRSKSRDGTKEIEGKVQNSYLQEKQERDLELLQIANRSANICWEPERKENQLRQERNKELAELSNRTVEVAGIKDNYECAKEERYQELAMLSNRKPDIIQHEDKMNLLREERRKELEELSNRKVDVDWTQNNSKERQLKEERALELGEIANRTKVDNREVFDTKTNGSEQMQISRSEELQQISDIRSRTSWETEQSNSSNTTSKYIETSDESRTRIQNTAAAWKEREKSGSLDRESPSAILHTPTHKIGSLFKKDSDYWKLNDPTEEFPEPPSEEEISSPQVSSNPPPPPRQSSREKIKEYTNESNWNAPWRKT